MGLDSTTLQLVFNVVMITGVTSLAAICHLLAQDKKKLTLNRRAGEQRARYVSNQRANEVASEVQGQEAERTPAVNVPVRHQDIRQFVAHRSQAWGVRTAGKAG
jgi:hypothetical protein